jgi:hypothetical protein
VFTSSARQAAARRAAEAAKQEAADAFVALDDSQQSVTMVVDSFASLDRGAAGRLLRDELGPLTDAGNAASQEWIDALDAHSRTLDHDDAEVRDLQAAQNAFHTAKQHLGEARVQLEAFGSRLADVENEIQAAWAQVSPKVAAAQQALADARRAVVDVTAAGIRSADLEAKLARAEELGKPVTEGAHKHGVAATLQYCADATAAATLTVTAATNLKAIAADTQRRFRSTKTRLDGISARLEQVPPTLSSLRRRFSAKCSGDLDRVPDQSTAAVEAAQRLLTSARAHASTGWWEAAAGDLEQCRQHLVVAEAGVNAVVQRLRDLDAVSSSPAEEKSRARFVVRDAQTLVVQAGSTVPHNEVRILDSLAARLQVVDEMLEGTQPDFWGYLVELRAIADVASAVVRRTRSAIATAR